MAAGSGAAQRKSNAQKMKISGKLSSFPFANADFISCLYMSINIYKQCKIAIKADDWGKKLHTLKMTGPQSWSGIHLRVIKKEGEIISDRLMELHHALGQ